MTRQETSIASSMLEASRPISAPPGFPRSEDEAADCAEMAGVPRDYAITLYHDVVSHGYRDMNSVPITVWRSFAKSCYDRKRNKDEEKRLNFAPWKANQAQERAVGSELDRVDRIRKQYAKS